MTGGSSRSARARELIAQARHNGQEPAAAEIAEASGLSQPRVRALLSERRPTFHPTAAATVTLSVSVTLPADAATAIEVTLRPAS